MTPAPPGLFYGWWMVAMAFVAQGLSAGCTTYLPGLFVKPMAEEFGSERGTISLGLSAASLTMGALSPFLGSALDRRPIRAVMAAGALAVATSFLLMASAPRLWLVGAAYATLTAFGAIAAGPLSGSKLVANWFEATRGRALGVASMGTSAGGAALPPLAAAAIEAWGWRGALAALGAAVAALAVPLIWLLVRNRPEDHGLLPDGAAPGAAHATAFEQAAPAPQLTVGEVLGDRNFWAIGLAVGLSFAILGGMLVTLHPFATDRGIDGARAAYLFTILSISGIVGKLVFGILADRTSKRALMAVAIAMTGAFLLMLLSEPGYATLAAGCAFAGLALGGFLPIWGALIAECWGRASFARVMGLMGPLMTPLTMSSVALPGMVFDRTGSYALAFQIFLGAFAVAAACLLLLRPPTRVAR